VADALDPFAPLSEVELATGAAHHLKVDETGEFVSPIPADAPPPPPTHFKLGKPTGLWTYRDADGKALFHVWRFDPSGRRKQFLPLALWREVKGLRWRYKAVPAPRPLYGLDRLAVRPDAPVLVCEGEKAADAAACTFPDHVAVTSPGGAQAANKADWAPLAGRRVIVWPDADEPGKKYAAEVAAILTRLSCEVSVVDAGAFVAIDPVGRKPDWNGAGWDAANAVEEWKDVDALRESIRDLAKPYASGSAANKGKEAEPPLDEGGIERRIAELSKLSEINYAVARAHAAKELGVPLSVLDRLVKARRAREDVGQGRAISFPEVEPWREAVNGADLFNKVADALKRYVILTNTQAIAIALWIVFSHVHDAFDVSPRLAVKSPQKRSGKTTLFSVLDRLVAKPRGASGITSSALLRLIELYQPTMLIDEMDALMAGDKEMAQALRGLMNAGFNRSFATFTMNVPTSGGGYEPREFSCWAAMALAGIGDLPDTVRDRSIEIEMKRKLPSETVRKLRRRDGADLNELARKLVRWARDKLATLRCAEPDMPEGLDDRAADAWEPLVAIADLGGGKWPDCARAAALSLSGESVAASKDEDVDTMLLSDVRDAFTTLGRERILSEILTNHLTSLEDRPWAEWNHGKPMSKFQLSKRLKKYGIVSGSVRTDDGRSNGYRLEAFAEAFSRYVSNRPISTRDLVTTLEEQGESTS
jgi:hypothetical protein